MDFSLQKQEKKFLALFLSSFAALYLLVQALPIDSLLEKLTALEVALLNFAGVAASSTQTTIFTPSIEFEIVRDCSGLVMASLLAALLFASKPNQKISWKNNSNYWQGALKTLLLFAPLLLAFNVLRLWVTLFAGAHYGQSTLDAVHFTLWIVDSAVVLLVWMHSQKLSFAKKVSA